MNKHVLRIFLLSTLVLASCSDVKISSSMTTSSNNVVDLKEEKLDCKSIDDFITIISFKESLNGENISGYKFEGRDYSSSYIVWFYFDYSYF